MRKRLLVGGATIVTIIIIVATFVYLGTSLLNKQEEAQPSPASSVSVDQNTPEKEETPISVETPEQNEKTQTETVREVPVETSAQLAQILEDLGEPLDSNKQNFAEDGCPLATYQVVNDRIFFWENDTLKCYNAEEGLREFAAIVFKEYCSSSYLQWLVSGDGRKVAWTEEITYDHDDPAEVFKIILCVADLDGKNKVKIVEHEGYFEVVVLASLHRHDALYYGKQRGEVGGRFVFQYLKDLYKLNTQTGKAELVLGREFDQNNKGDYITAVSSNGQYVAYFQGTSLFVREIAAGKETKIDIPTSEGTIFFANSSFSPDHKKLVFAVITFIEETDEEIWEYGVADLEAQTAKVYQYPEEIGIGQRVWIDNNTLEIRQGEKKVKVELE